MELSKEIIALSKLPWFPQIMIELGYKPVKMNIERFKKEIADYTDESGYVNIPLSILLNTLNEVANDKRG